MSRFETRSIRILALMALGAAVTLGSLACWELDRDVYAEGNYDIYYDDVILVYLDDVLIAEIDAAHGGEIPLTEELVIEYDELCSDPDAACPHDDFWDQVAIYQPLGHDNALLNAINIGTIGEPGQRLAGVVNNRGDFDLLLGLSASANEACLAIGVSTADGTFGYDVNDTNPFYDVIENGTITLTYAAGCAITENVILAGTLRFETGFTGVRTGDLDLGGVDPDPAIDEDGAELEEDQIPVS